MCVQLARARLFGAKYGLLGLEVVLIFFLPRGLFVLW